MIYQYSHFKDFKQHIFRNGLTSNLKEMVGTEYRSFYSGKGRPHGVTNADKEVRNKVRKHTRDKTMDDKFKYIPNDVTQKYPF